MGDATSGPVRLSFNPQLRVEFRGATVTSDAGLLLPRELDERLGLSALIERHLSDPLPEPRTALGALPVGAPTKHPEDLIVRAPGAGTAILWRSCHLPAIEGSSPADSHILRDLLRGGSFDSNRAERPKAL